MSIIHQRTNTFKDTVHLIENNAINDIKYSTNGVLGVHNGVVPTRNMDQKARETEGQADKGWDTKQYYQHVIIKWTTRTTWESMHKRLLNRMQTFHEQKQALILIYRSDKILSGHLVKAKRNGVLYQNNNINKKPKSTPTSTKVSKSPKQRVTENELCKTRGSSRRCFDGFTPSPSHTTQESKKQRPMIRKINQKNYTITWCGDLCM